MFIYLTKTSRIIRCYSVASIADAAFIIAGYDNIATVAQFKNNQWINFGDLNTARGHHGSVTFGQETMVVGGYGES